MFWLFTMPKPRGRAGGAYERQRISNLTLNTAKHLSTVGVILVNRFSSPNQSPQTPQ
jgi:hypothetical protein